jgi:hypothetical protein
MSQRWQFVLAESATWAIRQVNFWMQVLRPLAEAIERVMSSSAVCPKDPIYIAIASSFHGSAQARLFRLLIASNQRRLLCACLMNSGECED